MRYLRALLERLAAWYWGNPIAAERHRVEEDARRLNGSVTWND